MKKFKKIISEAVALLLAVSFMCCVCACNDGNREPEIQTKIEYVYIYKPDDGAEPEPTFALPYSVGENINLHTPLQSEYLGAQYYSDVPPFADGVDERSHPLPVHFQWEKQKGADGYEVIISTDESFKSGLTYRTAEPQIDIYNFMTGTKYYWKVKACFKDGTYTLSQTSSFTTADAVIRNLYIDGITNARDLGGWETPEGRVKQGRIIRCGRLNRSDRNTVSIQITYEGILEMRNVLGIKTEIDLREPNLKANGSTSNEVGGITSSPLGRDIQYLHIGIEKTSSSQYNYLNQPKNYQAIKDVFAVLADENNYPLIYHCSIGTDRTGLISFLVNGLLGVSEEDLYRDYLFSNFGKIGGRRSISNIQKYVDTVKNYEGETLKDKIENCLLDIGVKPEHISAIRAIMLDN